MVETDDLIFRGTCNPSATISEALVHSISYCRSNYSFHGVQESCLRAARLSSALEQRSETPIQDAHVKDLFATLNCTGVAGVDGSTRDWDIRMR